MTEAKGQTGTRLAVILDHTAALGGGEIALLNLVKAVDAGRWRVVVILFAEGPLVGRLKEAGVEVRVVALDASVGGARKDTLGAGTVLGVGRMWAAWRFVWRLRWVLRELRPAVVHCNSLKSDVLGGVAGRLARKRVVWHVRDRIAPEYLPGKVVGVFRRLARWVPWYVVANSHATLETLGLPGGFLRAGRRARVVHDGVVVGDGVTRGQGDKVTRGPGDLRIGIVGRISPWKGQEVFLRAVEMMRGKLPEGVRVRFQIIGAALFEEAGYEKEIRELAVKLGLGEVVEFTGFRSDVLEVIGGLDILVHASTIGEPFGLVVAEGMAAGKAVVATRGGGVVEIVEDGVSGLLVPMGDAGALAEAVLRLCGDEGLRERLGAAGRRRVEERFTIERTAAGVMEVWDRVCGGRG